MQTPSLDLNYLAPIPVWCGECSHPDCNPPRDPVRLLMRMAWHLDGRLADMRTMSILQEADPEYAMEVRSLNKASIECQMLTIQVLEDNHRELGECIAAQADSRSVH